MSQQTSDINSSLRKLQSLTVALVILLSMSFPFSIKLGKIG